MFKVGEDYTNRIGTYTVLEISEPKMLVKYEDGTETELNIRIQERIWENILAEKEAQNVKKSRAKRETGKLNTRFYIKPISLIEAEELAVPDWTERVHATSGYIERLKQGDRIIFYAIENKSFYAVATITGESFEPKKKDPFYNAQGDEQMKFFPVDVDAYPGEYDTGIYLESVELESQPDLKTLVNLRETFIDITEDEFENLAEVLTELVEEKEEVEEDDDEEEGEFDD